MNENALVNFLTDSLGVIDALLAEIECLKAAIAANPEMHQRYLAESAQHQIETVRESSLKLLRERVHLIAG